jgi:hypothetical protein
MSASYFDEVAPEIFERDLDRDQAGIPPVYMLKVSGVLLAGRDMLNAIGMAPGAPEPDGWLPAVPVIPEGEGEMVEQIAARLKAEYDLKGGYLRLADRYDDFRSARWRQLEGEGCARRIWGRRRSSRNGGADRCAAQS